MSDTEWPTRRLTVASLQLDETNPRLSQGPSQRVQRDIVQYLFDHEDAAHIARSIARNGYFPNEALLAVQRQNRHVVIEGNRRLAALKALLEPAILEGRYKRVVERLLHASGPFAAPRVVPVTVAPDRASTDRQIAVRHVGASVRRWRPENKANFILAKLDEGYDEKTLKEAFTFTAADLRDARELKAIAGLARSLDLPTDLKSRLYSPDPAMLTTLHRVFDSPPGREALHVERNADQVFRVTTAKADFLRGVTRLVTDVLREKQDSRSLNKHEDIQRYFDSWSPDERVAKRRGSFAIAEVISGVPPSDPDPSPPPPPRSRQINPYVLPKNLAVKFGSTRLIAIRKELVELRRDKFPNAGAVLLRVFFELMVRDYLERTGEMPSIVERLQSKEALPRHGQPTMHQLIKEVQRIATERLEPGEAESVRRALRQGWLDDLNAFVHRPSELPTPDDLLAFWTRAEPLFRLMLERPHRDGPRE